VNPSIQNPDNRISVLHGNAWAAWNASYHEPGGDAYRALAHALYQQAWHERIVTRYAELDAQNALLDTLLGLAPPR